MTAIDPKTPAPQGEEPTLSVPGDRDGPNSETVTTPDVETDRKTPGKHGKRPLPIEDIETLEDDAPGG
jgi:hypothetical protein